MELKCSHQENPTGEYIVNGWMGGNPFTMSRQMQSSHGTLVNSLQFCQLHLENEKKGEYPEICQVSLLNGGMNEVPFPEKIGGRTDFYFGERQGRKYKIPFEHV